jgi:hypothetical protein
VSRAPDNNLIENSGLALNRHSDSVSSTQAESRDTAVHVTADHLVNQRDQDSGSARPDWMSDGNGAAIHIHFVRIEAELAHDAERLYRERLV